MIFRHLKKMNIQDGDEVEFIRLPKSEGDDTSAEAPIVLCKVERWKRKNEKYQRIGMYSYETGDVVIPDKPRKSLEMKFLHIKDKDGNTKKVPFIVSNSGKGGYELYRLDGSELIKGIFKDYAVLYENKEEEDQVLELIRPSGGKALFNGRFEIWEPEWVDEFYEKGSDKYKFGVRKDGKIAIVDKYGKFKVPYYTVVRDPITLMLLGLGQEEEISIVGNGVTFGIYSIKKAKEIYPMIAKEIRTEKNERRVMNFYSGKMMVDTIVIVDEDGTERKFDFTYDFGLTAKLYQGMEVIFGRYDYNPDGKPNDLVRLLERKDGKFEMTDRVGLEIEGIGIIDSVQQRKNFQGLILKKEDQEAFMLRCRLEIPFYHTISIPPEFERNCNEEIGMFSEITSVEDGEVLHGIYSCKLSAEVLAPKFKRVTIKTKTDWMRPKGNRKVIAVRGITKDGSMAGKNFDTDLKPIVDDSNLFNLLELHI